MAIVFIVEAGQHGTNAENFYRMCPAVSVLPSPQILSIRRVIRVANPSLNSLLRAIIRQEEREIVIVSHGSNTQLALPVIGGSGIGVDLSFIQKILSSASNSDLAQRLSTNARNIASLRGKIQDIQNLNPTRVEFRACRIGETRPLLVAMKELFGAESVCAPRAFDGYGGIRNVRQTLNETDQTNWKQENPNYLRFGTSPNQFFWVNGNEIDPPKITHAFAESWPGVRMWIEANFPSGMDHRFRSGVFYYHAQVSMLPTSSSEHGERTFSNNFLFPNDPEYRQNLVQIS